MLNPSTLKLPQNASPKLRARYESRVAEWALYEKQYMDMINPLGVGRYAIDGNGVIRIRARFPDAGKKFTGDNDVFVILDSQGRQLHLQDKKKHAEVVKALRVGDTQLQHNDLLEWPTRNDSERQILADLIKNHTSTGGGGTGSEPLGVFIPGAAPSELFADKLLALWIDD